MLVFQLERVFVFLWREVNPKDFIMSARDAYYTNSKKKKLSYTTGFELYPTPHPPPFSQKSTKITR